MDDIEKAKILAAKKALEFIEDETILGLGTGSTVEHFLYELSNFIKKRKLKIVGIPTSVKTENMAKKLHIPLSSLEKYQELDLKKFLVIVDYRKIAKNLSNPVPVEVLNFARPFVERKLIELNGKPELRENFLTDNMNPLLDTKFKSINAKYLEEKINSIPGVVENGIFSKRKPEVVIIGYPNKVKVKNIKDKY